MTFILLYLIEHKMMAKNQIKTRTLKGISLFFIILFTYAAVSKLIYLDVFHLKLEQSPFIAVFADWLVWVVPVIQIVIALMFFSTRYRSTALFLSLFLMIIFTVYIFAVLKFAQSIPCSCGGLFPSWSWNQHLFFNIIITTIAVLGFALSYFQNKTISPKIKPDKTDLNFLLQQKQGKPKT